MNNPETGPKPEANETSEKVTELVARMGEILERARQRSIEALKPFTTLEPEEGQVFACFELFYTQDYGMGYNMFYIEKDDAGNAVLEPDYGPYSDDEASFIPELNDFKEGYFSNDPDALSEEESMEVAKRHKEQLFKWFSGCWFAAGGKESRVPTYLALDKEYQVRDLATGEVMSEEEAARRALAAK